MKKSLGPLTALFLKQLIHSKSLWIVLSIFGAMFIMNYYVQSEMKDMLAEGISYDMATRKATSILQSIADQVRKFSVILIIVVSALVAPESRKNGTTQFVLSLSIGRFKLAFAQFCALAVFIIVSGLIIHIGYVYTASRIGLVSIGEIAFAWLYLLIPLLIYSAAIFSISLSFSAIGTYMVFLAIPYVGFGLIDYGVQKLADYIPMCIVRLFNNVTLLYPGIDNLILWPRISLELNSKQPPFLDWTWQYVHTMVSATFWIMLGLWFYRNHDFGSRTAIK